MGVLFDQWRQVIDPFDLEGDSRAGWMQQAYRITAGVAFPFRGGGTLLRRRRLYPAVGAWAIVGFARPDQLSALQHDGVSIEPNMAYEYSVGQVLGNGFVGGWSSPLRIEFDGAGDPISGMPNAPRRVTAQVIAGGKFIVAFEYDDLGQGGPPGSFQVFAGAAAGSIDWNTPLVDSVTGLDHVPATTVKAYSFITAAYAHGTVRVFGVRARNEVGISEKNTTSVSSPATARATATAVQSVQQAFQRMA